MRDFIDLLGASGSTYRFRPLPESGDHLPVAGNYVVVREEPESFTLVRAAVADDLSKAWQNLKGLPGAPGSLRLYTRLNVTRSVRQAEHDDIVARYEPQP
jgi:hypothetical protein